jgi:glycosyltransferase involved in cell wall biosynthesis
LIGNGTARTYIDRLIRGLGLHGSVGVEESIPAAGVRERMRNADVYVLPSNAYEGWGAVVNEAMSEGCVVVASSSAGSALELIRHGENGFLFDVGDWRQLATILQHLYDQPRDRARAAGEARRTVREDWSPQVAADRFLSVSDALLSGKPTPVFERGPMSRPLCLNL